MQKSRLTQIIVFISSLIALLIGGALLFTPISFEATANIVLPKDPSLLSEIRAYGGVIIASGVIIMRGVIKPAFMGVSLSICSIIYLSIGISRLVSLLVDGTPSDPIITATIVEFAIGFICTALLLKKRSTNKV